MRALFLATGLLGLTVAAHGQTSAASAFVPLSGWDLPDVRSATYVRVSGYWGTGSDGMLSYHRETSGNAWLLAEDPGQSGRLVLGGAEELDAVWTENRYPEGKRDLLAKPACESRLRVTWRPAHLDRDLKLFDSHLATAPQSALADPIPARLFLMAYQLHQRGDTNAAGNLLQSLLRSGSTEEDLQRTALNLAAEQQLRSLNQEFQRQPDWEKFLQGLEALRDRFSSRWKYQPGLDLLIERVRERLVPEPEATDPAQRLGQRLEDVPALRGFGYNSPKALLLVPEAWRGTNVVADDPELEIWNLGLEAIPLLLARSEDLRLTRTDAKAARLAHDYGLGLFSGRSPEDMFEPLPRPATRGEVATRLLNTMLPTSVSGPPWKTTARTNVQNAARALYERCTAGGPDAVLVEYLDQRNSPALNKEALQALRSRALVGPVPALEQFLSRPLTECSAEDQYHFGVAKLAEKKADYLASYAGWRGIEAQPLVDRFAADLETNADLHEMAKELRALPLAATPAEVVDGSAGQNEHFRLAKLQTLAAPDALGLLLQAAVKTDEANKRLALAKLLQTLSSNWIQSGERPTPTLFADAWTKLLTDDRPTPDNSVALAFLAVNEQLYADPSDPARARQCVRQYGAAGLTFLRERVAARLAGTPEARLPSYPEQVALNPEDQEVTLEKLRAVTNRDEAAAAINQLPLPIRAALPTWLKEDLELNKQLTPLALTIVHVAAERDPALQTELSAWIGKPATAELGSRLHQVIAEKVAQTQRCDIILFRREHLGGCEISIQSVDTKPSDGFTASVLARELNQAANWRTTPLPEKKEWGTFTTSDPYTRRAFSRALEAYFSPEIDADSGGLLRFQTLDAP